MRDCENERIKPQTSLVESIKTSAEIEFPICKQSAEREGAVHLRPVFAICIELETFAIVTIYFQREHVSAVTWTRVLHNTGTDGVIVRKSR